MSTSPFSPHEIRAAAAAHRELGPEYSDAVIDSFLERVRPGNHRTYRRTPRTCVPRAACRVCAASTLE